MSPKDYVFHSLKKIDFWLPETSLYGALRHFTEKLYEAFARKGFVCRLIEKRNDRKGNPDLTIGFNGSPSEKGRFICDIHKIPHLAWLVDPPYRFLPLLQSPYMLIGCDDRLGCKLLKEAHFENGFFMPHGVEADLCCDLEKPRDLDIVFLGSFSAFASRKKEWEKKYPPFICRAMEEAILQTFEESSLSFIEAFRKALKDQKDFDSRSVASLNFIEIFQDLEIYLKGKERQEILSFLIEKGFSVHIFGEREEGFSSNLIWHSAVSYAKGLELMQRAKIVLNCSLKNKEGAHERIFSGLCSGALVATTESAYLRESFLDDEGILFYLPREKEKLATEIEFFLFHEEDRKEVAKRGREKTLRFHTWDCRVDQWLQEAIRRGLFPPFQEE